MSTHYQLIVFDWDGTLMDSAADIVAAMQQAILDLDLPARSPERMRELIGLGLEEVLGRLFPEIDTAHLRALMTAYRRRYPTPGNSSQLFPGVRAALTTLQAAGYWLAIATGKGRSGLDRNLADTGIGGYFRHSCCANEAQAKPAPAMLELIMLRAAAEPADTLVVGDTEYDMAMAAAAGVSAVGVACGVHEPDRLLRAGARTVLADVAALPAWLNASVERVSGRDRDAPPAPG